MVSIEEDATYVLAVIDRNTRVVRLFITEEDVSIEEEVICNIIFNKSATDTAAIKEYFINTNTAVNNGWREIEPASMYCSNAMHIFAVV